MPQGARLFRNEVVPFALSFVALAMALLFCDAALHLLDAVWVGRYLGIPGTLLILASFVYSARKRRWIRAGKPSSLLRAHERLSWLGTLLILVHAGVHFNAILAWLATGAMLINVASGLTGKYVLERARVRLDDTRANLGDQGLSVAEIEDRLYWDSLTFDAVAQWRTVHFPITFAFGVLAVAHIASSLLFWSRS